MATMAESSSSSSDDESNLSSSSPSLTSTLQSNGGHILEKSLKTIEEDSTPWIEYAAQQAQILHKTAEQTFDSFVSYSASRLSQIRSTSSAHFNQTLESLQDITSQYAVYENIAVAKMKEGVLVAASNPLVTCGVVSGLGFVLLKRPRRYLYYSTMRLLSSEQSMLSRAETKVKDLQKSMDMLKAESSKLENKAMQAEEEMLRGSKKLRQAGSQIRGVIRSASKVERQAEGLKDILGELPRREATRFRSQVSSLASEAKRERNALRKEVTKISNYGISLHQPQGDLKFHLNPAGSMYKLRL